MCKSWNCDEWHVLFFKKSVQNISLRVSVAPALWTLNIWQQQQQCCWLNYNVVVLQLLEAFAQQYTKIYANIPSLKASCRVCVCVKPNTTTITKMTSNDSRWNPNAEYTFLYIQLCACLCSPEMSQFAGIYST